MKFKNVSPRGDLDLAPAGVDVLAGATIDVSDDLGLLLAAQAENWEPVDDAAKKALASLEPVVDLAVPADAVVVTEPEGESK